VIADVVGDVAAAKEGRLDDVNDVVEGALEAVRQDEHDELDVTVEKGDRAVAGELRGGLARFRKEADDATEEV
jgi:hypothetical protein